MPKPKESPCKVAARRFSPCTVAIDVSATSTIIKPITVLLSKAEVAELQDTLYALWKELE